MNRCILIYEDATLDLQEHFNYLAQNSRDKAFLFFDSARETFAALARMPGMGSEYLFRIFYYHSGISFSLV
jgi:toxin ParE1/3/4